MSQDHRERTAAEHRRSERERVRAYRYGGSVLANARRSMNRSRRLIDRSLVLLSSSQQRLDPIIPAPTTAVTATVTPTTVAVTAAVTVVVPAPAGPDEADGMVMALALSGLDHVRLWHEYSCLGGEESREQLSAFLAGTRDWSAFNRDMLAHALNESLWQQGLASLVDYSWTETRSG